MPKEAVWSIMVPIGRQEFAREEGDEEEDGEEDQGFDESDFVTVRLGPTLGAMTVIGHYFNKV